MSAPVRAEASALSATNPPEHPAVVGDYELLEVIAAGGMGVVYRARQRSLQRIVALKLLPFGEFTREEVVRRFHAEAGAVARLSHPHIVQVHEVGTDHGQHFFSMDYVAGPTLAMAIREQAMPAARAVRLLRTVAEAVAYAHDHGILHRDLKPSNILLDELDQPRITDFGLAKDLTRDTELTLSGQTLGSPNYLPPEQAAGRHGETGPPSDIYSLGAVLYHLLTGRPPFVGETVAIVLEQVLNADPVPPRQLNPSVPRDLETICLKCLEKIPARRYLTAQALAGELTRWQRGESILARPASAGEKVWRWCRRRPALAGALAAAVAFLMIGFATTHSQWRRAEQHAAELSTTISHLKLDQAEARLNDGKPAESLALLAALLRQEPTNRVAAQRIVSLLNQRRFLRPLPGEATTWHVRWLSGFAQHGNWMLTTTNDGRTLTLWDTANEFELHRSIDVGEPVRLTAFSRDGRLAVVATHEHTLRLYDLTDGSLRAGPFPLAGFAQELMLDADAAYAVVVTARDDSLASWRTHQGAVLRLSDGARMHDAIPFHTAAISPDGRRLITVNDARAQVRDARTWESVGPEILAPYRFNSAEFSPDSRQVVTAGADSNVVIWDAETGQSVMTLPHEASVQAALFSPDGARVLTRDIGNRARFWDVASGKVTGVPFPQEKGHGPTSFSPDGRLFLSYSRTETVLRDTSTAQAISEPLGTVEFPTRARFLPDGDRFVLSTMDGLTRLWRIAPDRFAPRVFAERLELSDGRLSPDGTMVCLSVRANTARVLNAATGEPLFEPYFRQDTRNINTVRWSPDSQRIVSTGTDRTARLWEARTGRPIGEPLLHGAAVTYAEFSPDGRRVVTASEDGTARLWNATDGQPVGSSLVHGDVVRRARFSPDGHRLATASLDRTVRFWSVPDGRANGTIVTNEFAVHDVIFSPEGDRVAIFGLAPHARLWEVAANRELARLPHAGFVTAASFSPDGRRIVTGSNDGIARVWDAETGHSISRPLRHKGELSVVEFSPDGRFVLTASFDSTARLWDADSGHPVSDAYRHEQRVIAAGWSGEGTRLLTASYDKTGRLWPVFLVPAGPAPGWLADLAESQGGLRSTGEELFRPVTANQALAVFDRARTQAQASVWAGWVASLVSKEGQEQASPAPAEVR
jgi:WD40 repeat protein